jgi:hypothetical protein
MKKLTYVLLAICAAAFAAEGYKVLDKIKIGGANGWDYTISRVWLRARGSSLAAN